MFSKISFSVLVETVQDDLLLLFFLDSMYYGENVVHCV